MFHTGDYVFATVNGTLVKGVYVNPAIRVLEFPEFPECFDVNGLVGGAYYMPDYGTLHKMSELTNVEHR